METKNLEQVKELINQIADYYDLPTEEQTEEMRKLTGMDWDEITKYYKIFIQVGLTGTENGQEEDYMSLDVVAEIASPDDEIEFEVLSHGVM